MLEALRAEPSQSWVPTLNTPTTQIQRRIDPSAPNDVLIRCFRQLEGVDPLVALFMMCDLEERSQWDQLFVNIKILQAGVDDNDILFMVLRTPVRLVSDRDFVLFRRVQIQESPTHGVVASVFQRSTDHAMGQPTSTYVRAESMIGGYVFRRAPGETVTEMFVTTMSDPMGNLPKSLINKVASGPLREWCDSFETACRSKHERLGDVGLQKLSSDMRRTYGCPA